MKKNFFNFLMLGILLTLSSFAQQTKIIGSVKDAVTNESIPNVVITIEETSQTTKTNAKGEFSFTENVPLGEQVLKLEKQGYLTARFPIVVNEGGTVNITDMFMQIDVTDTPDLFSITLSDDELSGDDAGADNISGLLSSSRDIFNRTAAFEFSSSFFRLRGLDSENGKVMINGVEMNKMFNGRPQWNNWGGMNDVLRNQEFTNGLMPSAFNFGSALGTTNIDTRASHYRRGGRVTYSSSNRSYTNRLMVKYSSGLVEGGWAYSFSLGRRWGDEGYQDATFYEANSFFASVEKKINDKHSINFTGMYAPVRNGRSSSNTQEVFDLKGIKYNEFWGFQDGQKRNSRVRRIEEPIIMLNHYWTLNDKTSINTNVAYQFGEFGGSRLDNNGTDLITNSSGSISYEGGGANPSPTYYQKLPSYLLREFPDDPGIAFGAQQQFLNDGQIDWDAMYTANISNAQGGGNARYALYEDRNDDKSLTVNSFITTDLTEKIQLNAGINFRRLKSENFAEIIDLLGATTYLDVDGFAESDPTRAQNDLQNPNNLVGVGDKFRYHFNMFANEIGGFAQALFKYNKVDFYLAANVTNTSYQREGLFENGAFPGDRSFGKGEKVNFTGIGAKVGATYKITGKHLIDFNGGYLTKAPTLRNTFSNSRENHDIVPNITEEKLLSADLSYIYRSPIIKARLTGFYTKIEDANEISFFFADGIGNINATSDLESAAADDSNFVQEILQGIDKRHIGAELGIEAQITPTIKLKGAASYGQYTYDNNPNLYIASEDFAAFAVGQSTLKDYRLAGGPQKAYSVGFEYRDPDFWFFGATTNFFDDTFVDISPLNRSANFYTDVDGQVFTDYDEDEARELLRQEEFDTYMTVNLIGGKSWKIGDYFVGFFASINNLLDKEFRTGGFEQGRNANFRQLREDRSLGTPVFGNRYWYGRGATYFLNVYFRF
ncbi:carboxypeptidase regulatory-like domain-containing protein [Ichthyenterobacterium sp. W332]|uniref:Carboxypeptidase regulatory-like domain-containing protein n=1 Tax=Microcosmobacter mediterraneus TaxID=3075607 RepID=A0ABU2YKP2_9FLAO|nr:carboxypeptidase regulatory-like domain-containing protein [Ichthyenterobacterium sp. W332]MDT0558627.1 carboxypeptidase regulatory-like domain-containing protein [Ichthyenterobacterium sp. W332]